MALNREFSLGPVQQGEASLYASSPKLTSPYSFVLPLVYCAPCFKPPGLADGGEPHRLQLMPRRPLELSYLLAAARAATWQGARWHLAPLRQLAAGAYSWQLPSLANAPRGGEAGGPARMRGGGTRPAACLLLFCVHLPCKNMPRVCC